MNGQSGWGSGGAYSTTTATPDDDQKTVLTTDVNIKDAKEILEGVLQTETVPFLWGPPGIGKSSIVKQICAEKGWKIIDFRLSTVNPVDLMGMPTVDKKEEVAKWLPPEYLPKQDSKEVGVLFLDELNLAPLAVQAAAYQLILDKRVGAYVFPRTWRMVAAGNREVDRANVYKISAPLANRFMHITVQSDTDTWLDWAREKIDVSVISFLSIRPSLLFRMPTDSQKAFPTPRSWEYVSNFISSFNYVPGTKPSRAFEIAVMGSIGDAVGQEFLKYISNYNLQEVNNMVDTFIRTGDITLPRGNKAAEMSMRFAIVTAITNAYKKNKIDRARFEDFLSKLIPEERASVRKVLAEFSQPSSDNTKFTFLEADIDSNTASILVNDPTVFVNKEGLVEIVSPDGRDREIMNYNKTARGKGITVERGQNGTEPKSFFAGSTVKPL